MWYLQLRDLAGPQTLLTLAQKLQLQPDCLGPLRMWAAMGFPTQPTPKHQSKALLSASRFLRAVTRTGAKPTWLSEAGVFPCLSGLFSPQLCSISRVRPKDKHNFSVSPTLSTCFSPFLPAEPKHSLFPRRLCPKISVGYWSLDNSFVSKPEMGQAKSSQRPGSDKPLQVFKLNYFGLQNRPEISWQTHLSLIIPCPASLSPQMDICTSLAPICIAGTPRKLKQDQSSLVLGVV